MLKAFKYRIYPDNIQQTQLAQYFGCVRYIYNSALSYKSQVYITEKKNISCVDLMGDWLNTQKKEHKWLKDSPSQTLQMSLRNLDNAYTNFFKKIADFPTFKKKYSKQSCQFPQHVSVDFDKNQVKVPKLGQVKCIFHRRFDGKIKTCTISKTSSGKYFISILVEDHKPNPIKNEPKLETAVGIDLGVITFATISDGRKIANPKHLSKYLKKIQKLDRIKSCKVKGSSNYGKIKKKIARLHEKVANIRKDFHHKLSSELVRENQTICLEDLKVEQLLEKCNVPNINRSISDCGWSSFVNMLKYKCEWRGKNLLLCGRFDPSTKLCHKCGLVRENISLNDRVWTCENCQTTHDRDVNAAINIKRLSFDKLGLEQSNIP